MIGPFFVDTNVLIYRRDASEGAKQKRAALWLEALWRSREGRLSVQVLHEFYYTVTRKLKPGLSAKEAREEARELTAWRPVAATPATLELAWRVEERYGLSFWDSLIVGAAQMARCRYLLTEDVQDGQSLGGILVVDPFVHAPDDLGLAARP